MARESTKLQYTDLAELEKTGIDNKYLNVEGQPDVSNKDNSHYERISYNGENANKFQGGDTNYGYEIPVVTATSPESTKKEESILRKKWAIISGVVILVLVILIVIILASILGSQKNEINFCDSNPCMNGGTCTEYNGKYSCSCPEGFEGGLCQHEVNACEANPCMNGATCTSNNGKYNCTCPDLFEGDDCQHEINVCEPNPCMNGATCTQNGEKYNCTCPDGFEGDVCQHDICRPNPCHNDGQCVRQEIGYICDCSQLTGLGGVHCEKDLCDPSPCQNYGTCLRTLGSFQCDCFAGFEGSLCETDQGPQVGSTLSVSGAGPWGDWHGFDMCPTGSFATGFNVKIEGDQGDGDDSSMNAIQLQCKHIKTKSNTKTISSGQGPWGHWRGWSTCPDDYFLVQFRLKNEQPCDCDDTAVNGLSMQCRGPGLEGTNLITITGQENPWGGWTGWSAVCPQQQAICGIATRVEGSIDGDDTALNDAKFKCCYI